MSTMRIDGAGATGTAPVVQLDRIELEVLRDLVDLEAKAVGGHPRRQDGG